MLRPKGFREPQRSLQDRRVHGQQIVQEELVARVEVLQVLHRRRLRRQHRVPRGRGDHSVLQGMPRHNGRQLFPLLAGQHEGILRIVRVLADLDHSLRPLELRHQRTVDVHVLQDALPRRRGAAHPIRVGLVEEQAIRLHDARNQPIILVAAQHLDHGGTVVDLLLRVRRVRIKAAELLDDHLVEDALVVRLGTAGSVDSVRTHLRAGGLPDQLDQRGRGERDLCHRVHRAVDLDRLHLRPGRTDQRSQIHRQIGNHGDRTLRVVAGLRLRLDGVLRLRGQRSRQAAHVTHEVMVLRGTVDQRGAAEQVLRRSTLAKDFSLQRIGAREVRQRHVGQVPLRQLAWHNLLEDGGEHHRPDQRTVAILLEKLHQLLRSQPLPLNDVALVVHELHGIHELRRVAHNIRQRVGRERRKTRLLGSAERRQLRQHVRRTHRRHMLRRLTLVRRILQHQQVAGDGVVQRTRAERRLEVAGKLDALLQRTQQPGLPVVAARDRILQLPQKLVVRRLNVLLGVQVGRHLLRPLVELGDRHANVRGAQRLRQATRRVRRINGRKVRVPRCVRRLVLPDEVLLIVQPGHQLIHIGHVRHLLPELLRAQLVARLSQAVQQQLEPVVEIVEAAARALAAALDDLLRTPGRHQQTPPQDRLCLRRGLRHQRVHQESRCLIPVEHRDRHIVLQDVEVGIAHPRMLCQRRNHSSPVRQVKPFDLLQVLPQLLERAPQRRRGLLGRAGNLTPHLIIRRSGRVKGNPRLRSLQQRIHHDRVPGEMALSILRHRVRSIHRTRGAVVLRVTTQHRSRLLTVVLILVDQLGRHLAEREVTAEHIARHPQQLTHLEPAERRHQRRAGIHPTQPVPPALILRSDRALLRVRLLVDHLTDDPLQQRNRGARAVLLVVLPVGAPQVQGALAVELRDGNVRHRQHRVHIGDTLVDGVSREVPEHLNHTADRGVLHQHRIQLALRHTGAHPGVLLRHLRVDAALLFGVLLRTGAEAGVVQALPLTEDVIATGIRPQALRHRRSLSGNHTPHGGGIRVRRVRRILHVLRVFLGVRSRNRTLRQHQGPANLGVHGEPDVRPGVLRQTLHIRLTGDGESLEELVLRLRITTPDVHDQTIQRLVDPRDTPVLIQHPLLEVREQIHDGGHQGRTGRGNLADHLDARHLIAWSRYDQRGLLVVRAQEGARPQLHVLARVHHQASQRLQLIAVEVSAHALHRSIRHQDDAVAPARLRVRLGAAGVLQRNLRQEQLHGVRVVRGRPLQDRSDCKRRVHTLLLRDRERTIRPRLLRLRRINDLPGFLQPLVQSIHHGGLGSLVCRIAVEQIGLLLQVVPPGFGLLPDTGVPLLVGIQTRPLLDLLQALHLVGEVLRKLTDREHRMMVIPLRGTLRHQPRRVRRLIG